MAKLAVHAFTLIGLASFSAFAVGVSGHLLPAGPMHTRGNQIVDQNGNPVRIAAAGWNGGNDVNPTLEGLTQTEYKSVMRQIAASGINTIRLLTCDVAVQNDAAVASGTIDYRLGSNRELTGLTYLGVLDKIFDYAGQIGLRIIIDSHLNGEQTTGQRQAQQNNGLWYGESGITQASFLSLWEKRARRWKNKPALLGFDIRNEPTIGGSKSSGLGVITWGDGGANDIRQMYQNVGNAILAIDPKPLIIAEAPQNYSGSFANTGNAPWGDLTFAKAYPVKLNLTNKVVYSVHVYDNSVADYKGPDSGGAVISQWNAAFGYLEQQDVAPVWVGECGDTLITSGEKNWASTFIAYLNGSAPGGPTFTGRQQGMGWDWWVWGGPESPGLVPNFGMLTSWTGSLDPTQQKYWSQMLQTATSAK